uniref:Uncharacterized protein n=1 Tax=Ixodes ricinus TaxID=34613 RepID=A0A6B0UDT6_IXORI
MVDGTVGSFLARFFSAHAILSTMAWFPGSTFAANLRLLMVYSWPQNTLVASGSFASFSTSALYIWSAVPSKNLPQPAMNMVSPVKTAGASPLDAGKK